MSEIVTLTMNPAVDKSTVAERVVPNRKLRCAPPRREPGGGGLNVSRAIRELDGDSLAVVAAGGPTGDVLRDLLEEEGVMTRILSIRNWTRENLMVREEKGGDHQFRFDMPGAELSEGEWRASLDELDTLEPAPRFIVASGSLPPGVPDDFFARVGRLARKNGASFILDSSGEALRQGLSGGVYLAKPNLRELENLSGQEGLPSEYEKAQGDAARELISEGRAETLVVSMGSAGALLVTEAGAEKIATPTVPIRSRVGAGDSMVAGMVFGLARGLGLKEAARLGVMAGAAAVMTPGSELFRRSDLESLYGELP